MTVNIVSMLRTICFKRHLIQDLERKCLFLRRNYSYRYTRYEIFARYDWCDRTATSFNVHTYLYRCLQINNENLNNSFNEIDNN